MREFKNAKELLALCSEKDLPISEIMRQREIIIGEMQEQEVNARMTHVLEIMKEAAFSPIKHPVKSMGGLIGGESKKLFLHQDSGKGICVFPVHEYTSPDVFCTTHYLAKPFPAQTRVRISRHFSLSHRLRP